MNLLQHLNFYIFQLIHAIKTFDIEFIIDNMTTILMKKTKRFNYIEKKKMNRHVLQKTYFATTKLNLIRQIISNHSTIKKNAIKNHAS